MLNINTIREELAISLAERSGYNSPVVALFKSDLINIRIIADTYHWSISGFAGASGQCNTLEEVIDAHTKALASVRLAFNV